jgi:hypothetical protein
MDFSLLPASYRVDLKQVSEEKSLYAKLLWESIGPGWTAIFIFLTGLYYYYRSSREEDDEAKKQLRDVAFGLTLWGLFNIVVYILLVYYQRGKRNALQKIDMVKPTDATL